MQREGTSGGSNRIEAQTSGSESGRSTSDFDGYRWALSGAESCLSRALNAEHGNEVPAAQQHQLGGPASTSIPLATSPAGDDHDLPQVIITLVHSARKC